MKKIDARQLRTREKLHNAAITVYTRSTQHPTIKEICNEAKITRPTFYNHFANVDELKDNLTESILNDMRDSLTINHTQSISEFDPDEMPKIFTKLFSHIEKNFQFYKTFLVNRRDKTIYDGIFTILKKYIKDGMAVVEPSHQYISPNELIVNYVSGAYYQCIVWWIEENKPYPATEMYTHMIKLSLVGPYSTLIE